VIRLAQFIRERLIGPHCMFPERQTGGSAEKPRGGSALLALRRFCPTQFNLAMSTLAPAAGQPSSIAAAPVYSAILLSF
jgi:hypothetical protein